MSEPQQPERETPDPPEPEQRGPSLTLLYTLVALAIAAAIGCAILIVLPFYHRLGH